MGLFYILFLLAVNKCEGLLCCWLPALRIKSLYVWKKDETLCAVFLITHAAEHDETSGFIQDGNSLFDSYKQQHMDFHIRWATVQRIRA